MEDFNFKDVDGRDSKYTVIQNKLINNKELSLKAKMILIYMLSKPDEWNYSPKNIAENSKDGIGAVYSGLKELIKAGYVSRKKNSNGEIEYYIFEDNRDNNVIDIKNK